MNNSNKSKRVLILIMSTLFIIGIGIAFIYYYFQNKYQDHRIIKARELYNQYNDFAQQNDFVNLFRLLDSIEAIYSNVPHYTNSYEIGVIYNNRSAAYLTMALHFTDSSLSLDGVNVLTKKWLVESAKINAEKSKVIYQNWLNAYGQYTAEDFNMHVKDNYLKGLTKDENRYWQIRLKELKTAQIETKRRLSVVYTNLGIIDRYNGDYENAIAYYQEALALWNRNLTAENNINKLLGKPVKKQNFIHKILPPDKSN